MQHHRPIARFIGIGFLILGVIYFLRPDPPPPKHLNNVCVIFHARPQWYWAARAARKKWGISISTQMAFIFKESHFHAAAKPVRERLLGLIPWRHSTSAEGYAQALNLTWQIYLRETHQRSADRYSFSKAADFIGWYLDRIHRRLHIPTHDVFRLYLAYHEGAGAYKQGSYLKQPHLIAIAERVSQRAARYKRQLLRCEKNLPKKHGWFFL